MKKLYALCVWGILLACTTHCLAQNPQTERVVVIGPETQALAVSPFADYLIFDHDSLSFEEVLAAEQALPFQPVMAEAINFGFVEACYWFRLKIKNNSQSAEGWLLESSYPIIDSLFFWQKNTEGQWERTLTGDMIPFSQRNFQDRKLLLPLHIPVGEERTFYFKVATQSSVQLPLQLKHQSALYQDNIRSEVAYGIFYGFILVMVLYNFFIFLSLRDINYLYYVVSIGANVVFFTSINGHSLHLWGDWVWWANKVIPFSMGLLAFGTAMFARSFLVAHQYAPKMAKLLWFVQFSGLAIMVMAFTAPYGLTVRTAAALLALNAIIILTTGIICWRAGYKAARYFVVAWVSYLIGAFMIIMRNFALLPNNFLTDHGVEIGNALEVILLSLALSDKYSLMRREKEKAQALALQVQREANETLEHKVVERTRELAETNEELNNTIEELDITNTRLNEINIEIEKKNADITASINYARRIQEAMLPKEEAIRATLNDFFVYFQPRDIVSGDFYWYTHKGTALSAFAAVDCTGHGVPGAFMSMIGNQLLHDIIDARGETRPDRILQQMHEGIRKVLRQKETANQDGMDMSLCVIDHEQKRVYFGGAKNPLLYVNNGEMNQISGSKFSIGGKEMTKERVYEAHEVSFAEQPLCCYLFSDGYPDQFGGDEGRKFMIKRLKDLLLAIHELPMPDQGERLKAAMEAWKSGQHKQIDDILVIGFRLGGDPQPTPLPAIVQRAAR